MRISVSAFLTLLVLTTSTYAAWDESLDGDLSTNPATPTPISLGLGSNSVAGTIVTPADTRDYLTFTLVAGQTLDAIELLDYSFVGSGAPGDRGFFAIFSGAVGAEPAGGNHLYSSHLDQGLFPLNSDILPSVSGDGGIAGTGLTLPVGAGTYTFLVQQTGSENTAYEFDFQVIPEPASFYLASLALALVTYRRR